MSAFWEGGRGALELVMVLIKSRQRARVKRIGCTVNVYRNESKQSINPNNTIFRGWLNRRFETDSSKGTDFLYRDWNGQKVTDALPL
jgi:hypothetical protein